MKIISVDNYDRDEVDDVLIAENVNESTAKLIVELLNNHFPENSNEYFKAVPDDHKLYKADWE